MRRDGRRAGRAGLEELDVAQDADVVRLDEVDRHALPTETATTSNPREQLISVLIKTY